MPVSSSDLFTGESRVDGDFSSLPSAEDGPLFAADVDMSSVFFLTECIDSLWPSV